MGTRYCKKTWLNPPESSSTGSVVAFDGKVTHHDELVNTTYLEVADCFGKITLHRGKDDNAQDFINKMKLLRDEINLFLEHLEGQLRP